MVTRINSLTDDQRAKMDAWADKWIEVGLRTGRADRPKFEAAAEQCYRAAGLKWHGNVVWVPSPIVMAIAAPVAALVIEASRKHIAVRGAVGDAVRGAVGNAVRGAVDGAVGNAVRGAVGDAVRGAVGNAVGGAVYGAVRNAVDGAVDNAVDGAVRGAVDDAVGGAVGDAVGDAVYGAVRGAVGDAVRGAVRGAVGNAVGGAVRNAVDGAVGGAVYGAVGDAVGGAVGDAVYDAVGNAVYGAVRGAVDDAVDGAVGGAVGDAVYDAVDGAVYDAVGNAVRGAVYGAVGNAVGGAVRGAVGDAVGNAVGGAVRGAVGDAVGNAVDGAVRGAVDDAVGNAVYGAVRGAVDDVVDGAVGGAVRGAVRGAVGNAVRGAVDGAVDGAVGGATRRAVADVIRRGWVNIIGGQFWVGGWWGGTHTSFFREICGLDLKNDLWKRGLAYEATMEAACWWYPHRDFIIVCERPAAIHRELANPSRPRGWGSHRLHCADGLAVAWADGWGVYSVHGVQIPFGQRHVVERPELITVAEIESETNAEIRRVMIDRYGPARYIADSGAIVVQELPADHSMVGLRAARLLRKNVPDDEPIIYVDLLNSTPEPDGTTKRYMLRIDPAAYDGEAARNVHAAAASTWRNADGSLHFQDWRDYAPSSES